MMSELIMRGPVVEPLPVVDAIGQFFLKKLQATDKVLLITEVSGKVLKLTRAQLLRSSQICACMLREHNLQTTDTVMISCGNTFDFLPVFVAATFNGVAASPVSPASDINDFRHLIEVIKPRLVLCDAVSLPVVQEAVTLTSIKPAVLGLNELDRRYADEKNVVDDDFRIVVVDNPQEHVSLVMTSSGTTGRPKGVEYTGYALQNMLLNMPQFPEEVVGMSLSGPYWASGVIMQMATLAMGGTLVLLPVFTEKDFLEHIQKYQVNFCNIGPDQVTALAKWPHTEDYELSSLFLLPVGGARVHPAMHELAEKRLKKPITPGYGMTESFSGFDLPIGITDKPGSVGKVSKNSAAKIVDVDTGELLGPNREGEVCYKAPIMFKSYRGNPEATRALFDDDGFIHTGDVGYYDEDGYFFIVDRIKELIKYKLMQVPAVEIEEVLLQHDCVQEAAVVGIQNLVDTEHATAFVVKQPGKDVTAQELVALVQEKLPKVKWLHGGAYFVDSIPKTPSGKTKKRQLRAMHEATNAVGKQKL